MKAAVHLLTVVVGSVVHGEADFAAHNVSLHEVAPGGPDGFAESQESWEDRDCRMPEAAEVIVVESVAHGAVHQSGVEGRGTFSGGQNSRLLGPAQFARIVADDVAQLLGGAGENHAHQVETRLIGDANSIGGNIFVCRLHNPFGYFFSCAHGLKPPVKVAVRLRVNKRIVTLGWSLGPLALTMNK